MGIKAKKIEKFLKLFRILIPICDIRSRYGIG